MRLKLQCILLLCFGAAYSFWSIYTLLSLRKEPVAALADLACVAWYSLKDNTSTTYAEARRHLDNAHTSFGNVASIPIHLGEFIAAAGDTPSLVDHPIIFAAHHKTGSTIARSVGVRLCCLRAWICDFRKTRTTRAPSPRARLILFPEATYEEVMRVQPPSILVHWTRSPPLRWRSIVRYHRRCAEPGWGCNTPLSEVPFFSHASNFIEKNGFSNQSLGEVLNKLDDCAAVHFVTTLWRKSAHEDLRIRTLRDDIAHSTRTTTYVEIDADNPNLAPLINALRLNDYEARRVEAAVKILHRGHRNVPPLRELCPRNEGDSPVEISNASQRR